MPRTARAQARILRAPTLELGAADPDIDGKPMDRVAARFRGVDLQTIRHSKERYNIYIYIYRNRCLNTHGFLSPLCIYLKMHR